MICTIALRQHDDVRCVFDDDYLLRIGALSSNRQLVGRHRGS